MRAIGFGQIPRAGSINRPVAVPLGSRACLLPSDRETWRQQA